MIFPGFITGGAAALPEEAAAAIEHPDQQSKRDGHWGHHGDDDDQDGDDADRDGKQRPVIVLQEAAASAWDDGQTVGTQLQLRNLGKRKARNLRVTRITVDGRTYQGPGPQAGANQRHAASTVGCTARMRYVQFGRPPVIIK